MEEKKPNPKTKSANDPTPEDNLFMLTTYVKKFFQDALALDKGVDKMATIKEIRTKNSMSGANAWMLMCSIVIASVGLNMNSPAVIIGAMLISPLMSPILGIGMAVGINDKDTLKKSLAHLAMAVLIALITSTLYFLLTPLGGITEQISARTAPGPLDIIIALFGGIAGIVSIARKDISTTIPGVAIATALMPPLCVTGFGIATSNWEIVFTSFLLFFINTVFVAFATYIVVHFLLKFPQKDFINKAEKRKNNYYILGFLFLITVLSYFPFRQLLTARDNFMKVEEFIEDAIGKNRKYLDDYRLTQDSDSSILILKVYGDSISTKNLDFYNSKLLEIGLKKTKIEIIPTTDITMDDISKLHNKISGIKDLTAQFDVVKNQKSKNDKALSILRNELLEYKVDSMSFKQVCDEIKVLQPDVEELTFARGRTSDLVTINHDEAVVLIKWVNKTKDQPEREDYLNRFLKLRLKDDSLKIVNY